MQDTIGSAALAAIVRASLDAIVVADLSGRVQEFNPAAVRMFGWSRDEALGRPIGDLIVPPDLRAAHERGMEAMRRGAPPRMTDRTLQMRAMARDGRIFPCALSVTRLAPPHDGLFAASIRDLTEIEAERERRAGVEAMLRAIFDDQTEVIFRYDANRRMVFYNKAACTLYGVSPTELLGRHLLEDVDPEFLPVLAAQIAALTPEAPIARGANPKRLPNGQVRWFDWTNRALYDAEGRLTGFQAVGRDITEEQLARRDLAASEARFAAFMRHAPVGMYLKDEAGRYMMINPEMERVFGLPAAQVIGRHPRDLIAPSLLPVIEAADAEVRATGRPSAIEEHIAGADAYEWTLVVRFPIEPADGGAPLVGGFDIDISAIRRAEIALQRAREDLQRSEKLRALGHFAAGMAHELNNPLAIIAGQAELLAEDAGDGPLAARAGMIRRAAARCGGIVRNALALVRGAPPERRPADLDAIVRGAVEIAAHAPDGSSPQIAVVPGPQPLLAFCDPDQIHQVVLNPLTYAREALLPLPGRDRITVTTGRTADGQTVTVEVADTGRGVPEALRAQVFEAYFTTKPVGTGIGLAFCRAVAEAHDGRIDLAPASEGACFRLSLPAAPGPAARRRAPWPA